MIEKFPLCQRLPCQERLPRPGEVARKCRKGNSCRRRRLRGFLITIAYYTPPLPEGKI